MSNQKNAYKNFQSYENGSKINTVREISSAAQATTAFSSNKSPTIGIPSLDNNRGLISANRKSRAGGTVFELKRHTVFSEAPSQAQISSTLSPHNKLRASQSRQGIKSAITKAQIKSRNDIYQQTKQSPLPSSHQHLKNQDHQSTTVAKSCLLQTEQDQQQFYKKNSIIKQVISKAQLQHMVQNLKKRQIMNRAKSAKKQKLHQQIQMSMKSGTLINSQQRQYLSSPASSIKARSKISTAAFKPYEYVKYLEQTKEQRAMQNYENTSLQWDKQCQLTAKKNGRKPDQQILNRIEIQRRLEQQRQGIQITKPLKEKFGDKYWEYSLRSTENPKIGELRTLSIGREMQGLYSKFYQRGMDSMPAVVRKANKLFQNYNQNEQDQDENKPGVWNMKSQKRLVAFENKSLSGLSKNNKNTKIDEFTEVKNYKIIDNASTPYNNKSKKKQFQNTLAQSKYLKSKIKNGGLKGFVKNYLKNLPQIQNNIEELYVSQLKIHIGDQIKGESQMLKEIETVQRQLRAAQERECDLNSAENEYLIHIFPETQRDDLQ